MEEKACQPITPFSVKLSGSPIAKTMLKYLLLFFENASTQNSWALVIVALIGAVGTIIAAYLAYKGNKEIPELKAEIIRLKSEKEQIEVSLAMAKQEIDLDSHALSFSSFMENWADISAYLKEMFGATKTSRFLILRAWNGYEAPRYTTAIVQYRQGTIEHSDYIHFELDEDYVQKLSETRRKKISRVDVAKEGPTAIGGVYRSENPPVTYANWHHIHDERVEGNRIVVTYCSFATTENEPFTEREEVKHLLLVNKIKMNFDGENHNSRA